MSTQTLNTTQQAFGFVSLILLGIADVQQQGIGIEHDTVGGAGDNGGDLASNLNLSQLDETRLVLDSYYWRQRGYEVRVRFSVLR